MYKNLYSESPWVKLDVNNDIDVNNVNNDSNDMVKVRPQREKEVGLLKEE